MDILIGLVAVAALLVALFAAWEVLKTDDFLNEYVPLNDSQFEAMLEAQEDMVKMIEFICEHVDIDIEDEPEFKSAMERAKDRWGMISD